MLDALDVVGELFDAGMDLITVHKLALVQDEVDGKHSSLPWGLGLNIAIP